MKTIVVVVLCLSVFSSGFSQSGSAGSTSKHFPLFSFDSAHQKDMIDVLQPIFVKHPKPRITDDLSPAKYRSNFSGLPAAGYTLQTGFAAILAANASFYTAKNQFTTPSVIATSVSYSQYNQIIFPLNANIHSTDNKYNIVADWRYMKYPSTTFGLGGHSDESSGYTIDFSYIRLHQYITKAITRYISAGLGYDLDYFWKIREIDPPVGRPTSFQQYGLTKTEVSSGISLHGIYDSRANSIFPLQGLYANVSYRPNLKFFGSDNNWQSLVVEWRKYFPIPVGRHNVLALWNYNWFTVGGGKPPYLMLPSTGWDPLSNTGRGYIQGRYRGRNMVYFESEYRFDITPNGLFGMVVFANAQSFSRLPTQSLQTIAPGAGLGLRIKINKFSGSNLCIDYGFGNNGSKGFFVNLGEVF